MQCERTTEGKDAEKRNSYRSTQVEVVSVMPDAAPRRAIADRAQLISSHRLRLPAHTRVFIRPVHEENILRKSFTTLSLSSPCFDTPIKPIRSSHNPPQ